MKDQARVVVIGGGITGCCVLYHLALAGWKDVVLIEKGEITSGATCMAMGLLTQFNSSPTMMRFRKYSAEMFDQLDAFYVPISGFNDVERPGPSIYIYKKRI